MLAGFCSTQLTDTLQEANGLADTERRATLPVSVIRSIVFGERVDVGWQGRPQRLFEFPLDVQ